MSVDPVYPGPLERHLWSLCVLFLPSLSILSIAMLKCPSIILFSFCSLSKKRLFTSCSLVLCLEGVQKQRTLLLERVTLKVLERLTLKNTNLSFGSVSTTVTPSRHGWSWAISRYLWLLPGERKIGPNQLFLIWSIWSCLILVLVKILMHLFCFLQNSSAKSYFKGSLMPPTLAYNML